ncbi:MAG: hypothetical protein LBE76_02435, partial [Nitrososphaerota archaeon]|nr:hypothetical protein [Nitrososphaerota archaeon]
MKNQKFMTKPTTILYINTDLENLTPHITNLPHQKHKNKHPHSNTLRITLTRHYNTFKNIIPI